MGFAFASCHTLIFYLLSIIAVTLTADFLKPLQDRQYIIPLNLITHVITSNTDVDTGCFLGRSQAHLFRAGDKRVRNVLQEDQAKNDMLVLSRVD